jgi:hypothetical protein
MFSFFDKFPRVKQLRLVLHLIFVLGENARFLKKNFMISKDKATTTASVGMRMVAARVGPLAPFPPSLLLYFSPSLLLSFSFSLSLLLLLSFSLSLPLLLPLLTL